MKPNYLIYTVATNWDEPPRARKQVANVLKRNGVVYFVQRNKVGKRRLEIRQVEPNVYVITPYYWLNDKIRYRTPVISEMYHHWLLKELLALRISFDLVFTFDYTAPAINSYFDQVIFYCADDHIAVGKYNPWFIKRYLANRERKVAEGAKMCVVTSEYMHSKIGAYNKNTFLVPLGAPDVQAEGEVIPDKSHVLPVLGLVGFLDNNMDFTLIKKLLQQFRIVFVGPMSKKNYRWMVQYPNAYLAGTKTGKELYELVDSVDVCIAPYDVKKINKGLTPNKLWLYLSRGKPAVVTEMPNIRNWQFEEGVLYTCTNDVFIETIMKAYQEDSAETAAKRIAVAKENTWEKRLEKIMQLYHETSQVLHQSSFAVEV